MNRHAALSFRVAALALLPTLALTPRASAQG